MTRPLPKFSTGANRDVVDAVEYYEAQRVGAGLAFLDELDHVVSVIHTSPLAFAEVDPDVRRALLGRFPFGVSYTPGELKQADAVIAVLDLRQDPKTIRQRYRR